MRICMVVPSLEEFGGLEEIATTLAVSLRQQGHQVCFLSTAWAPSSNQYLRRLRASSIPCVQVPKWLYFPVSYGPTKEKILAAVMVACIPLVYLLSGVLFLLGRRPWAQAYASSHGWVRQELMRRVIGPDRRHVVGHWLLSWLNVRYHPDVVHLHGYTKALLWAIEWANARKIPVAYEEHQTPDSQFDWWQGFERKINKADVVIAASDESARALRSVCGVTQPIATMTPLVADPGTLRARGALALPQNDDCLRVTTFARLYVTKGLTYLLDAAAQVKAAHPSVQFRVFGEGSLREELLDYASRLGLDGNAIFVGAFTREEMPFILQETDIFLSSSILEGLPVSVVEAMAYGCPIVATTVGGTPEVITDGVNGLLCAPADAACLAQKLRALVEDPSLRVRLGRAARESYERGPFQPAAACDHFIGIYERARSVRSASLLRDSGHSFAH